MRRIVLVTDFATVTKEGERVVFRNGKGRWGVPVRYVDMILTMGKLSLSGDAVNLLLKEKVPVFFLTRLGKLRGSLFHAFPTGKASKRVEQLETFTKIRVSVAKSIVQRKTEEIGKLYRIDVEDALKSLERAESLKEVLGVEGEVSKRMFEKFGENIKDCGLEFNGRSYNPPKDRVNALLSLTYTVAYCLAFPLVLFAGYDPYLSFLHTGRGSHASLCSDIIEPVRPFLTKSLEDPLIRGVFSKKDFSKSGEGFYLKKEALSKFLSWFEGIKEEVVTRIRDSIVALEEVVSWRGYSSATT